MNAEPIIRAEASRSSECLLRLDKVSKRFGREYLAVDEVNISVGRNEFFTLVGPSGCGKTTLLRMIAGFSVPTTGRIVLEGKDLTLIPPNRRPINTVFQSYALFPHLSVAQNVAFGLRMLRKSKAETREAVHKALTLVRMNEMAGRRVSQLSGGQQQRVALARALAPQPKLLLLDEPLSALDLKLRQEMQAELKALQLETAITFIFVTHDQEEALTMSDRIAVMNAGRLQQIGRPADVYDRPANRFVAGFVGDTNFLKATCQRTDDGTSVVMLGETTIAEVTDEVAQGRQGIVTVAVRPENLSLTSEPNAGAMPGTLVSHVYRGADTFLTVELRDGQVCVARRSSHIRVQVGEKVSVVFPPERLVLFP